MVRRRRRNAARKLRPATAADLPPASLRLLGDLVIQKGDRVSEYKRRKPRFLLKKVDPTEIGPLVDDGWIERRKVAGGKTS